MQQFLRTVEKHCWVKVPQANPVQAVGVSQEPGFQAVVLCLWQAMPADHCGNKIKVLGPYALKRCTPFGQLFLNCQNPMFLARIVMASRQIVDECCRSQLRYDGGPVALADDPGVNHHACHMALAVDQAPADKIFGSWLEYFQPSARMRIIPLHRPMFAGLFSRADIGGAGFSIGPG